MYFKRIELQGFKSFADPVTIELNDGITCIIGPNGSGKSNISDALRWVLGEQSSKQLRGSKMQDVIFAGTNTRKPKGMAEVTLVIDNTSGILPLEYNEVAVTRRMFRSGESEYLINGNNCRLRDIKELFMDTGIGVDGYSIIGQGQIAEIVSTKAENRRQIFEEAAGVVLYKSRKHDAELKLNAAQDNLDRVRDILAEIESRIGTLKEDSEKATEFIELRDRYKKLGINIILNQLEKLDESVSSGKLEQQELQTAINELTNKANDIELTIEDYRRTEADYSSKHADASRDHINKINELNEISSSGQVNSVKLQHIEEEIERLSAKIKEDEDKLLEEEETLKNLLAKDEELAESLRDYKKKYNEEATKYNNILDEIRTLNTKIEDDREEIYDLTSKMHNEQRNIDTLESYKKTLHDRIESLKADNDGNNSKHAELKAEFEGYEKELSANKENLDNKRDEINELASEITEAENKVYDYTSKINDLSALISRTEARKSTIEEMENNYEGYNNAVRAIMRKSFDGIIGTVSDLITVPKGYELAIETALGGQLQNIVCKNDASAKNAVSWLKQAKAGRATFLPVSSIRADKHSVDGRVESAAGFIGIGSDIVSCDEYPNISDYLLCRTIIVDNMDNAVAISKMRVGGFRLVTLDGEIISSAGSITGGKYANKTANLLDRKKEIEDLSRKINDYKNQHNELFDGRTKADDNRKELLTKQRYAKDELQNLEIAYNVCKSNRDHAYDLLKDAEGSSDKNAEDIKLASDDIKTTEETLKKSHDKFDSFNQKIEDTKAAVQENLELVSTLENTKEELSRTANDYRIEYNKVDSEILKQNELTERVRDTVADLKDSIEQDKNAKISNENDQKKLTSSGSEASELEKKLKEEKSALEGLIKNLEDKIEDAKQGLKNATDEQKKINQNLESKRGSKYTLDMNVSKNETLLDTQKDKLWDEFEVSYAEAVDMKDPDFVMTSGSKEAKRIKLRMAELGDVNIGAIAEYEKQGERYRFLSEQEADTTKAMSELQSIITNMDKTIKTKFKETFDTVVVNFEETFKELFGGGYAELRLEDEANPLESSIEITAQPPGKKLKNINLLSGGEKTLTAIALMFAVLKSKPTPFVILDEVEAALDEVNIERFSGYLRNFDNIQFALITHQKVTMEHADVLYGVTMPEQGVSRMLSLKLGDTFDVPGLE